jgi:CheY-like chemotaxis protein
LKKFGIDVVVAENGIEALKALEDSYFDLVLMDCQMPLMDGLEATRQIRQLSKIHINCDITVVALTANNSESDREACFKVGMNGFIDKPVNSKKLLGTLEEWLTNPSA